MQVVHILASVRRPIVARHAFVSCSACHNYAFLTRLNSFAAGCLVASFALPLNAHHSVELLSEAECLSHCNSRVLVQPERLLSGCRYPTVVSEGCKTLAVFMQASMTAELS